MTQLYYFTCKVCGKECIGHWSEAKRSKCVDCLSGPKGE